jgi:haloalkane dehalogenase
VTVKVLRTPDERFEKLDGYPFEPHYTEVDGLRVHHVDEGPRDGGPVLMLHGEPTWSYLYRHMVPVLAAAGYRALAPDLVGFGRSDKPSSQSDYTYERHVGWMAAWIEALDLVDVTLVCQDWGSLIGLRVAAEHPERFARVVVANGFLPTGDHPLPLAFHAWRAFARATPVFPVGRIVRMGCATTLSREAVAGYDAPFPDESYKQGARAFPQLVPSRPDDPATVPNRRAWEVLERWEKPFLTAFGDRDPITRGADRILQRLIPGAAGQPHTTVRGAGHFIQEDRGVELAGIVADFIALSIAADRGPPL